MSGTDEKIITKIKRGDRNAFGALVEKYKAAVFAVAFNYTKNEKDAEDIVQEVFIKAYTKLPTLRDEIKFAPWLSRIAQNTSANWIRDQLRKREVPLDNLLRGESEEVAHLVHPRFWTKSPDEELEAQESSALVMRALDSLSEENRLTTMMYYMNGLTYSQIAEFQDVPVSTVKGRLYQSRKKLKKEMIAIMEGTLKEKVPGREFTDSVLEVLENVETTTQRIHDVMLVAEEFDGQTTRTINISAKKPDKYRIESEEEIYVSDGVTIWRYRPQECVLTFAQKSALKPEPHPSPVAICGEIPDQLKPPYISEYLPLGFLFASREDIESRYIPELDGHREIMKREGYILRLDDRSDEHKRHTSGCCSTFSTTPLYDNRIFTVDVLTCAVQTYPAPEEHHGLVELGVDVETFTPLYQQSYRVEYGCGCNPQYVLVKTEVTKLQRLDNNIVFPVEFEISDNYGGKKRVRYHDIKLNSNIPDEQFVFKTPVGVIMLDYGIFENVDESIAEYKAKVQENPDDVNLHYALVELYRKQNPIDWGKILVHREKIAQLKGDIAKSHLDLAGSYLRENRYQDVIDVAQKALNVDFRSLEDFGSLNDQTHFYLSRGYEGLGQREKALFHKKRRLEIGKQGDSYNMFLTEQIVSESKTGELPDLIKYAQLQLKEKPDEIYPHTLLGLAAEKMGDKERAVTELRHSLKLLTKKAPQQSPPWNVERKLKVLGMYKEIAALRENQLKLFEGNIHRQLAIKRELLDSYAHTGEYKKLSDTYWDLLTHGGLSEEADGEFVFSLGVSHEERVGLADKLAEAKETPALCILCGGMYLRPVQNIQKAIEMRRRAVELLPDSPYTHAMLGAVYFDERCKNYAEAANCYQRAMELDPEQPYYRMMLAFSYQGLGEHDKALEVAAKAEFSHSKVDAHIFMGTLYWNMKDWQRSIDEYQQAIPKATDRSREYFCRLTMSIAQDALGLHDEAEKAYDAMSDWWMFRERMNAHKYFDNPDGALRLIEKAIAQGSRDWHYGLRTLTELFRNHNRQRELLQFFQEALYENPNNAEIYKAMGKIYQESGKQDDARMMYKKAVTFQPRDVHAHLALGEIYAKQELLDEAIKSYKIVLEQDANWLDAYENLASVYERAGKAEEAAKLAEEFPQHFEEDFQNRRGIFHKIWADLLYAAGQYEQAAAKYQRAIELEPENVGAKQGIAKCYEKLGRNDAADNIRRNIADAEGRRACIANLKIIGTALRAYIQEHGRVPDWLNELCEEKEGRKPYITDLSVFHCPADVTEGRYTFSPSDPNLKTSYRYQFNAALHTEPKLLPSEDGRVVYTWKDFKEYQRKYFGDVVPIVRCSHHAEVTIDLTYGGDVIESTRTWETSEIGIKGMLSVMRETIRANPDNWTEIFSPKKVVDFFKAPHPIVGSVLDRFATLFEPLKVEFAENAGIRALSEEIERAIK